MSGIEWSAAMWNERYPEGTPVDFFPTSGQRTFERTHTRSEAWTLGHGEPVVAVAGRAGGVSLGHLTVLLPDADAECAECGAAIYG